MISLDTNGLVRYLVVNHPPQADAAGTLLAEPMSRRRGFICREVSVALARILDRAYGFSRNRIATVFKEFAATDELHLEATDDTIQSADRYHRGGPDFAEQMIAAASKRSNTDTLRTPSAHLTTKTVNFRGTALSSAARR